MDLSIFGFQALWSPYYFLFTLSIGIIYIYLVGPYSKKHGITDLPTPRQKTFFLTGVLFLYVIKGSPMDLLGHLMFSAHMTQMALLYLGVVPLLILGTPNWMFDRLFNKPIVKPIMKLFTQPIISLVLFNGIFSIYHIPVVFDLIKSDHLLHGATTIILFLSSFFMWWPLLNSLPGWESLSGLKKIGYIFADGVLLTPACALIIFADTTLYTTYTDPQAWLTALGLCVPSSTLSTLDLIGPQAFNTFPLIEDQQLGGVMMKIIQEIIYGAILAYVFFQWFRKENSSIDPIIEPKIAE